MAPLTPGGQGGDRAGGLHYQRPTEKAGNTNGRDGANGLDHARNVTGMSPLTPGGQGGERAGGMHYQRSGEDQIQQPAKPRQQQQQQQTNAANRNENRGQREVREGLPHAV